MHETLLNVSGNIQEQASDVFQTGCGCEQGEHQCSDLDEDEVEQSYDAWRKSFLYSAGGAKDFIALCGFILAYWIIYTTHDMRNLKQWLLAVLILCIFVDGLFSLYPEFHNTPIGYNYATGLVIFGAVAAISGLLLYYGRKRR